MRRTVFRSRCCLVSALAVLTFAASAGAQTPPAAPEKISVGDWQLAPTAEVRLRAEYRRDAPDLGGLDFFGRRTPRVRDAWMVMERARLGVGVERGAVKAQITLQDARALGSPSPTAFAGARGLGRFEPYEAYGEVHGTGARPAYVRFGRQAVVWGEGRLVGNADFAPAGRSLDAVRGHVAFGAFDVEALAAVLEIPRPLGDAWSDTAGPATTGVQLYGLTGKWSVAPLLKVEAFALARISRSNGEELDGSRFAASRLSSERYTGALRVSGDASGWAYGAEGAYQLGSTSLGPTDGDIAAWAAAARVEKSLVEIRLMPKIHLTGSYASGDDRKGAYKQFDPLLADPQRFHGPMDLFGWSNLIDVGGGVEITPWTDTIASLGYRYARLAQARGEWVGSYLTAVGSTAPPSLITTTPAVGGRASDETELGHELDVGFAYRPWAPLELRASWSGLLLGDGAKAIMATHVRGDRLGNGAVSPANIAQYAFVQATVTMP